MYKIAILGCENFHADAFVSLIKEGKYPDIEVVGVYSDEEEPPKKLNEAFGVPVMKNYDELVGKVDGIMVTARHGANHYKYAKPYLSSGIPMFIDKPITIDGKEAEEFMSVAEKYGVRFCGGSTCVHIPCVKELKEKFSSGELGEIVGGHLVCPINIAEKYGGFYFYTQHLVQIMTSVFGNAVERVYANRHGDKYSVIFDYGKFDVTAHYGHVGYYICEVYGENKAEKTEFVVTADDYKFEMDEMASLLKGGEQKTSYKDFIYPVKVLNAIKRSEKNSSWEIVK